MANKTSHRTNSANGTAGHPKAVRRRTPRPSGHNKASTALPSGYDHAAERVNMYRPLIAHGDAAVKVHGFAPVTVRTDAPVRIHGDAAVKVHGETVVKVHGNAFFEDAPTRFRQLYDRLKVIDFFGTDGELMPKGDSLTKAVKQGSCYLPKSYIDKYAAPLENHLEHLVKLVSTEQLELRTLETIAGAVYQHGDGSTQDRSERTAPLRRFLAVISNLYRSFLADEKRACINVKLSTVLPPLAMFQHDGGDGPFTITVDDLGELMGAGTGVVSMPTTYAKHPILWAALAHEVSGHGVTHADDGLIDELAKGVSAAFAGMAIPPEVSREQLIALWSYWMDEAAADVYGILNMGPAFVFNQAVFFALCTENGSKDATLRMESRYDSRDPMNTLDPHPTDILRLHLAAGVIDTLSGLLPEIRSSYNMLIERLAESLAEGDTVTIDGNIPLERDHVQPMHLSVPLYIMQQAARNVGGYIATATLSTLGGHSIQDIETWDNNDENQSLAVKKALLNAERIDLLGDDAQLLAGSTWALLADPGRYDAVTFALNEGLDLSFRRDPIWGKPPINYVIIRYGR